MADILIRNLPDAVVADIDADAARLGLSRVEYVRRQLIRESQRSRLRVTVEDLVASSNLMNDLLDDDLMERAWR
ncbi:plasmid stability protein [Marisediminicola sp. UYEF4]|uniref:type II toxin-antitoxin system VapB family antitoxin n=1 Tax=Marisediminicola sp. UYEF4 TaxID=1756384 RepID=UPI00339B6879